VEKIKNVPFKTAPAILLGGAVLASNPEVWNTIEADAFARTVSEGLDAANRLVAGSRTRADAARRRCWLLPQTQAFTKRRRRNAHKIHEGNPDSSLRSGWQQDEVGM